MRAASRRALLKRRLTSQLFIRQPGWPVGGIAKAASFVLFVGFEIAFKPFDMAVALKGEHQLCSAMRSCGGRTGSGF